MDVKTEKAPMVAALLAVLWSFGAPAAVEASLPLDAPSSRVFKTVDPFTTAPQMDLPSLAQQLRAVEERRAAASDCVALCEIAAGIDAHPFGVAAAELPNRSEDAWGNYRFTSELNASANRFGFTGHYWDKEASLYYAKARYYDPFTARFTQADSFLGTIDDPPSLHRYFYANANPTFYVDPSGNASERPRRVTTSDGYSVAVPQDGDYTEAHADPIKQIEYELASGQRDRAGAFTAAMDVYQEPTNQLVAVGALPSTLAASLLAGGPAAVGGFVVAATTSVARQTAIEKRSLAQVDYTRVQQEGIFGAVLGRLGQLGLASRTALVAQGTRLLGYGAGGGAVISGAGHVVEGAMEGDASKALYGTAEMALGGAGIFGLKQMSLSGDAPRSGIGANKIAGDSVRDVIAAREAPAVTEATIGTYGGPRRIDVLKVGDSLVSIESKVGRTSLGSKGGRVRQELARDWWSLRKATGLPQGASKIDRVRWEFTRSDVTGAIGPTKPLLSKLQKLGFDVVINEPGVK